MNTNYMTDPAIFIIDSLFSLYILAVMLRFLLQWSRAEFYNPISQFLVKITNPVIVPLRRAIPGLFNIDIASVLLLLALKISELALVSLLIGQTWSIEGLLLLAVAELLGLLLNVFLFSILIQVVLSRMTIIR